MMLTPEGMLASKHCQSNRNDWWDYFLLSDLGVYRFIDEDLDNILLAILLDE